MSVRGCDQICIDQISIELDLQLIRALLVHTFNVCTTEMFNDTLQEFEMHRNSVHI